MLPIHYLRLFGLALALFISPLCQADDADPLDVSGLSPDEAVKIWNETDKRIAAIESRFAEINQSFQKSSPEEQKKLREEALKLLKEIEGAFRKIGELVPVAYPAKAAAGNDPRANQLAVQAMAIAFEKNRYGDAARIADVLLSVSPDDRLALNLGGVAHYAIHDFEKAVELLAHAQEKKVLIPDLGGRYIDSARRYVDYWEKERAIRMKEAAAKGDDQLPRVQMETTKGTITLELFENEAPNTVANFISLVEKGYYNGSPFHRVINNFMAQGGMPGKGFGGTTGPGYTIDCECYRPDARRHFAGTLSMAHAGKNTGGSQFFITHLPTEHLDKDVRPESVHTVFGRVLTGMNVVAELEQGDKILSAKVLRKRNHPYVPKTNPQ